MATNKKRKKMKNNVRVYGDCMNNERILLKGKNAFMRSIKNEVDLSIFNVTYKGFTFDAHQFIFNTCNVLMDRYYLDNKLYTLFVEDLQKFVTLNEVNKCEFFDVPFTYCILPLTEFEEYFCDFRFFAMWSYLQKPKSTLNFIIKDLYKLLCEYVNNDVSNEIIQFKGDVANTQAFSFLITLYWLIQKIDHCEFLLMKYLKKKKFFDSLENACPEDSILYKFLSGEITKKEYIDLYITPEDNIFVNILDEKKEHNSIVFKEMIQLATNGLYTDLDHRSLMLVSKLCQNITITPYESINTYIARMNNYNDVLGSMSLKLTNKDMEINNLSVDLDNVRNILKDKECKLNELQCNYDDVIKELNNKNDSIKEKAYSNEINIKLSSEIDELTNDNKELSEKLIISETEVEMITKDNFEMRQELSNLKKELKRLNSIIKDADIEVENNENEINLVEDVEIPLEDIISNIKDKKIVVMGSFLSGDFENRFKDLGLDNVKFYDEKIRQVKGNYDVGVILTSTIKHSSLRRFLKNNKDLKLVYSRNVDVISIIRSVYEQLEEN